MLASSFRIASITVMLVAASVSAAKPKKPVASPDAGTAASFDVGALVEKIKASEAPQDLERALNAAGFTVKSNLVHLPDLTTQTQLWVTVSPPMDAAALARALGLGSPCAFAIDVHQKTWILSSCPALDATLRTSNPASVGEWELRPRLEGRPSGKLPAQRVGPSPAYDVTVAPGRIVGIELSQPYH